MGGVSNEARARVAVVDDEADLRAAIRDYLNLNGFDAVGYPSGAALLAALADQPPTIVLLDLNMPGEHGLSIASALRRVSPCPGIIMVTAAADTVDRVVGLEVGADDYLGKPFEMRELLARIRALARRLGQGVAAPDRPQPAIPAEAIRFSGHVLDLDARVLRGQDGRLIPLTAMEFDLLAALARHPNRVLTREVLLDLAHGKELEAFDRSIDVRITRLRRKIEADQADPRIIRTVRGVGYMFVPDGRAP